MSEQTEHGKAEQRCIEFVARQQGLGHDEAARFFTRGLAAGWFDGPSVDPELRKLITIYRDAVKYAGYAGAGERHLKDVLETGRQAVRER